MNSAAFRAPPNSLFYSPSLLFLRRDHFPYGNRFSIDWRKAKIKSSFRSLKCKHTFEVDQYQNREVSCSAMIQTSLEEASEPVSDKKGRLVSEFRSLTEPIDRVRRLLDYAAILPPFDESARVPENRVTGCTTQVWLDARMDQNGKIRFRADSDSEITKGFCSCLIWMLDGADPEEVVGLRTEELAEMNVGVHGKEQSRVNTWHNVLVTMQKRTKALMAETQSQRGSSILMSNFLDLW